MKGDRRFMNLSLLYNRNFTIKLLAFVSVIMFCSLFTIGKIIGVCMSLWIIVVFWNMKLMLDSNNVTLGDFVNSIESNIDQVREENKVVKKAFFYTVIPMIFVGLIMIIIILFNFFFLLP